MDFVSHSCLSNLQNEVLVIRQTEVAQTRVLLKEQLCIDSCKVHKQQSHAVHKRRHTHAHLSQWANAAHLVSGHVVVTRFVARRNDACQQGREKPK